MKPGPKPEPRFPFAPIERVVIAEWQGCDKFSVNVCTTACVALRLHVRETSVYRYRRDGVPLTMADRFAIHLGLHPAIIWPDEWCEVAA